MFIRKFVKQFSRAHHHHLTIPYYPKGYKNPPFDVASRRLITKEYEFDESGFIFAFNNLISSLHHEDFYEFAQKTCDPQLVEGFKNGMEKLKADDRKVEIVFDPDIEEEISFAQPPNILLEVDQDQSLYSQSAIIQLKLGSMNCEIFAPSGFPQSIAPLITMTLGCYIKCSTSLRIQGLDMHPYSYHFVEFQMIKDPKIQVVPQWKMMFEKSINDLVIGKEYQWRIINIDGFLKKAK